MAPTFRLHQNIRILIAKVVLGLITSGTGLYLSAGHPLAAPNRYPSDNASPMVDTYSHVIDEIFPRRLQDETPSEFLMTLRYVPSVENASQIVISKRLRGGYTVTYYSLPPGSKSIDQQFMEITEVLKIEDPIEIAKRIKVVVQNVNVPTSLVSRQLDRIATIQLSPLEELDIQFVHPDNNTYQFWLEDVGESAQFY